MLVKYVTKEKRDVRLSITRSMGSTESNGRSLGWLETNQQQVPLNKPSG